MGEMMAVRLVDQASITHHFYCQLKELLCQVLTFSTFPFLTGSSNNST